MVVAEVATGKVVRAFRLLGGYWDTYPPVSEAERSLLVYGIRFRLDGTMERPTAPGILLLPPVS